MPTTVTRNISAAPTWLGSHAYTTGNYVLNSGNSYICSGGGTSASSGGPTGTGTGITDGSVHWDYVAGVDYSTLQTWEDACPANLVTDDKIWKGECYDQGEFTGTTNRLTISGTTADSTRYIVLTCATGASFKDKAGVRTTALDYNSSNGVAIKSTNSYVDVIVVSVNYTQLIGLQVRNTTAGGNATINALSATNVTMDSLIVKGPIFRCVAMNTGTIKNSCLINPRASSQMFRSEGICAMHGCTLVGDAALNTAMVAINSTLLIKNTAMFGASAIKTGVGSLDSNSDYNATDLSSVGVGSHNQTSLTFANQFQSSTNDFRAVDTGSLDLNGTPDSTNLPTDISGTTRDASTPTIGCWEVVAAAGGQPAVARAGGVGFMHGGYQPAMGRMVW